jgi:hypothetical protein
MIYAQLKIALSDPIICTGIHHAPYYALDAKNVKSLIKLCCLPKRCSIWYIGSRALAVLGTSAGSS